MEFIYHHRTQGRGGEGVHIMSIVRALESEGHAVEIVSPPGVDPRRAATEAPPDKAETRETGIRRLWKWISAGCPQMVFEALELAYNFFATGRLLTAIRSHPRAVYYERYAFFLFIGVLLAKIYGRRVILEVNEVAGVKRARDLKLVWLARWIERRVFRGADVIFTVSSFLRERVIAQGARPESVILMPNGVETKWFSLAGAGREVRESRGFNGSVVLGFVGWFDYWDRLDLLIDVVADLREQQLNLKLMLVGSGPMVEDLEERVRSRQLEQVVTMTGAVKREEIPGYIDAMDICVMPDSNPFGSPIVLFEFMAMGKPVVAPDLAPILDVVEHQETGWIIRHGNSEDLTRAVRALAQDETMRKDLGDRARDEIRINHTWVANGKRVADVAAQLVGTR